MAAYTYESATDQTYNAGVVRVPNVGVETELRSYREDAPIWADVLHDKDVVGGQVAEGFKALFGTPLANGAEEGVYVEADDTDYADAVGVLLLSTDAYDGARQINVVKGGSIRTDIGALAALDATALGTLAGVLGGKYDAVQKSIKF